MVRSNGVLAAGVHDVDVDGTTLRYTVAGDGPVCLMHSGGFGVSPHYLRMPAAEEHVTAVYLDPIGTGGSGRLPTHPNGYTIDFYVRCVEIVIDHLGMDKVYFLGHSFGGFVAQQLASQRPDLLDGIILYDTTPTDGPDLDMVVEREIDDFARRFAGHPELPALLAAARRNVSPEASDEVRTKALRNMMPLYFADFWGRRLEFEPAVETLTVTRVVGDDKPFDFREKLDTIDVRTVILVGRYDFVCPPMWSEQIHRSIVGSRLVTFEQSGHLPHLEEPELFAAAIAEFVSPTN